jgi:hypothetical protein
MKWKDIVESPKYQAYSPEKKKETRERFWNEIVAPNIEESERSNAYLEFNQGADRMEGINAQPLSDIDNGWTQELTNLDPAFRQEVMRKAQQDKGFLAALRHGKYNTLSARAAKSYAPDTALGKAIEEGQSSGWQPETGVEELGQEVVGLAYDMPWYVAGTALGAAGGGPIGGYMGMMGLPAAAGKLIEKREEAAARGEEYDPDFYEAVPDLWDVSKATAKGMALGATVGKLEKVGKPVANKIAQFIPGKAKGAASESVKRMAHNITDAASTELAQTTAITAGEHVLNDAPVSKEKFARDMLLSGLMRSLNSNPQARQKIQDAAKHKGVKPEDIIKNVDPQKAQADNLIGAIDEAIFKTEKQIELQRAAKIQDAVIDKQIRANYKDGKSAKEIIQINQIPKEYRPFILDQTESGGYTFKPDVLKRVDDIVSQRDGFAAQKYEDVLPGPIRDMQRREGQAIMERHAQIKADVDGLRENFQRFKESKPELQERLMKAEMDKLTGNYRRYESMPKLREKMDATMAYIDSVLTPEQKFKVVLEPDTLMDHINFKESGFDQLKPAYQDAIKKEIAAKYKTELGLFDSQVEAAASKKADNAIRAQEQALIKNGREAVKALDSVEKNPTYKQQLKMAEYENKTTAQKAAEMKESLRAVDDWAVTEKAMHLINFKRSLGESESFGQFNRSNKEFFGESHYGDTLNFAKKSPAQIYKKLSTANFLKRDIQFKGFHPDMFLNKPRVAKNYLGKHIYDEFVAPLRQAEYNATKEIGFEKQRVKEFKRQFKPLERDQMGEYLISLDKDGLATLQEMGITPPTLEQLSQAQQAKVTEVRQQMDVYLERINTSRADVGLPPIERRENYVTFMRKFSLAEELGYDPTTISVSDFNGIKPPQHNMKHYSSRFLKERIGGTRPLETDLAYVLDTYANSTLKTIHNTPVIGKLRLALNHETGFFETNPHAHKFLHDYLDVVAGKKVSETKGSINAIVGRVSRNVGVFVLAYNIRSAGIQPTAVVNAIGLMGPKSVAKGLKDFMSKENRAFAQKESKVLLGRSMDITVEEITRGAKGKYGKAQAVAADYGTMPLRVLDTQTATITWLSAYRQAKEKGMTHREAVVFSDDVVNGTQASASRIDLAPVQHTPLGKAFTLFNTFVINNLNFLKEDVAGYKKVHKLVEQNIPLEQAKAKYGAADTMVIKEIRGEKIKNPDGSTTREPSTATVYETMSMLDKKTTIERSIQLAAAWTVCNTIYEVLGMDENPPLPAPLSAFYEGYTGQIWVDTLKGKEVEGEAGGIAGGMHEIWKEMMTVLPVSGGAFVFGGESVYGAVPALVIDTAKTLGGQQGSKPLPYIIAKWAGIPGGQQVWKSLKAHERELKENEKQKRKASPQYIKQQIRKDAIKDNPALQQMQQMRQEINKIKRGY